MMLKLLILITTFTISTVYAVQDIQIVGGTNAGNPKVAVITFNGDGDGDSNVSKTIADDLSITGEFSVQQYADISSVESNVKYIVSGSLNGDGNISFKLVNTSESAASSGLNQNLTYKSDIRKAAHTISNNVYQKITNVKGIFTTKIAYIIQNGSTYQVMVSDYDGYNQRSIFSTNHPITSLAWDSTGRLLAYVSFESGKPVVYVQDLYQAKRYQIANFDGSNSSPAFTPDGTKLAVTLTKDYGSHIYLVNNSAIENKSTSAARLIDYGSIDTEASFSSNGNMVFTSNHDGGPQIFMSSIRGTSPIRLTMNLGKYNTTPRFSHDASKITFINRSGGVLKTYVMDLTTKSAYPISLQTNSDMAPSFAPNDKLVLFSSNGNSIYIGNVTGTIQTRLNKVSGIGTIIDQRWANNF